MRAKSTLFCVILLMLIFSLNGCNKKNHFDKEIVGVNANKKGDNSDEALEENPQEKIKYDIAFSHTDNFYSDDIEVEIISQIPSKIYYTLDGSDPDEASEPYQGPIKFTASDETEIISLKAKAFFDDGMMSENIVHTYFIGKDVYKRFDTLVFSITTDPYNLYDYEHGILIEGKLRDDFVKENPFVAINPDHPANYNMRGMESERESYIEVLEPDGTRVIEQLAGIRVYGGWSRAHLQKSIRILARRAYDDVNNKLRYEFFPQKTAANGDGSRLREFKRLVLRSSGNDNGFAFIRDELFQTLAGHAGYKDYQAVRPAVMFINGDYHGVYWLHEVQKNEEYFKEHYGSYKGYFETLEGGETFKDLDEDESNQKAIDDYNSMYDKYSKLDLTDDKNFQELSELMDVDNYLRYYALQIYIGNEDWPHNNYKTYRYYKAEDEKYGQEPFDGKWRYFLHDLDYSFGIYGTGPYVDNIQKYIGKNGEIKGEAPMFGQLMQREDCKQTFITMTLDLINGAFAPSFINTVLDEMHASRIKEQERMYGKNLVADWVQFHQLEGRLDEIRNYGIGRSWHILKKYKEYFGMDNTYELTVEPSKGSEITINTFRTKEDFKGNYYSNYETLVKTTVPAGQEFDYWLVNGSKISNLELVIDSSMIKDEKVQLKCVFKEKAEDPKLIISELSSAGDKDYIILHNPYSVEVSLAGYSITDDLLKEKKFRLPGITLKSGESIKLLCEKNPDSLEKGQYRTDFNLKAGESLVLFRQDEIVDEVLIPNLINPYRRDLSTMRFYEIDGPT